MKSGGKEAQDQWCRICLVCGGRFANEWDLCSTECSKDFWAWAHDAERLGQSNSLILKMMNEPISWFSLQVLLGFLVGLYMLPGIIALARHHHQSIAIVVLNVVAGWTVIGWVVALVWSRTATKENVKVRS